MSKDHYKPTEVIDSTFSLESVLEETTSEIISIEHEIETIDIEKEKDFLNAKARLEGVQTILIESLDAAKHVAKMYGDPKSFDSIAKLGKAITEVTNSLVKLHEERAKTLKGVQNSDENVTSVTNNSINFIGSNTEFQEFIDATLEGNK